jgi:uncharacterized glyoxalase superfamily protein PhnB
MLSNRSIPHCSVIPELTYANVNEAAAWLDRAFGFSVRVVIADHRIQMNVADCAIVLVAADGEPIAPGRVLVRVDDADGHHERAMAEGAAIVRHPATYPFGERQYSARDLAGHSWTFSQSVADVAPEEWGGTSVTLD